MYPKKNYPEMVSGVKESHQRAYKFATLTIIADDTPIVLAIEPVRDKRRWEPDDVETRSRGSLLDRLLSQAEQHVDINKVVADREFDSREVRHKIDQHDMFYILGRRNQADADSVAIQKTIEHETADVSVEQVNSSTRASGMTSRSSMSRRTRQGTKRNTSRGTMRFSR